jgi:AraC family transcriptional regulator
MEHRIERRGALRLAGVALRTTCRDGRNEREIPELWQRVLRDGTFERLRRAVPAGSTLGVMGICVDKPDAEGAFTYVIGIEAPAERAALPEGAVEVAAPAGEWAAFTARGALPRAIQELWPRIMGEWFPGSGYELAGAPSLEVYPPGDPSSPDYRCEIWLRVRRPSAQR